MSMEKVLRVNQLDACELDDTVIEVLQNKLELSFRPLQATRLLQYLPEFKAILRFLVWKFSLSKNQFTLGQEMLRLKYKPLTAFQRAGLFTVTVLAEWIMERAETLTSYCSNPTLAQRCISWAAFVQKALSLFNFVNFLIHGTYPTLKELTLGLKLQPSSPQTLREVSNIYLTREILWHGFSEFIFFILPHFNVFTLQNWLRRTLGIQSATNTSHCGFCDALPVLPHLSNCGHVYCYYCLKSNLIADANFSCTVCNNPVTLCIPVPDVM